MHAIARSEMEAAYPRTLKYLQQFEGALPERKGFTGWERQFFDEAYYARQRIGDYTFSPVKLVWREQASELTAAIVDADGARPIIPADTLMLVPFDDRQSAHFVCALLNSTPCRHLVASNVIEVQTGKYMLAHVRIPEFNPRSPLHVELSNLSEQAHAATSSDQKELIADIERRIDELASGVWGLMPDELAEPTESLKEIRS